MDPPKTITLTEEELHEKIRGAARDAALAWRTALDYLGAPTEPQPCLAWAQKFFGIEERIREAVEREREECAKMVEPLHAHVYQSHIIDERYRMARDIRARGKK